MKKLTVFASFVAILLLFTSQTPPPNGGPPPNGQPPRRFAPVNQDSLQAERERYVKEVLESIKGKENMAADSVFRNIKIPLFKTMPAKQFLNVMNGGYSKSLGMGCNGCHNVHDWGSEEKSEKQMSREMAAMTVKINTDLLHKIDGMQKENINCTTCHQGRKKPRSRLD